MAFQKIKSGFNKFFQSLKLGFLNFFKSFNFTSRTKGAKVFKITFFFLLYAASIVGLVFGLINVGKNNTRKGMFGSTYNTSYKLDYSATSESEAKTMAKKAIAKFTNYLAYNNVNVNNINYQIKPVTSGGTTTYETYLYVSYSNVPLYYDSNYKNSSTDGYYEIDPHYYGLNNQSSSTVSVYYFNPQATSVSDVFSYSSGGKRQSEVLSSNNFDYSTATEDTRKSGENNDNLNNYGIKIKLTGSNYQQQLNDAGLESSNSTSFSSQQSDTSSGTTATATSDLQWIVIKDIDSLVNMLNYAKWVVYNYNYYKTNSNFSEGVQTKWNVCYDYLNSTNSNLVTWATKAVSYSTSTSTTAGINTITPEYLIACYEYALGNLSSNIKTSISSTGNFPEISKDGDSSLLDVVKDYVIGVVSKVNYKQWFPAATSTTTTINGGTTTYFSIQPNAYSSSTYTSSSSSDSTTSSTSNTTISSKNDLIVNKQADTTTTASSTTTKQSLRSSYIYKFKNLSLPTTFYHATSTTRNNNNWITSSNLPLMYLNYEQSSNGSSTNGTISDSNNSMSQSGHNTISYFGSSSWTSNPFINSSTISKISSYNSVFLASGVILLLIATIVSVWYRIPGLMSSLGIILSFGFSLSFLVVFKIDISIPSMLGLFIGTITSVMAVSLTMERMRRLTLQRNSVFDSIQTAIKKSMLSVVDLNVTLIVIGLSLFFIAKGELTNMGITMLLSGAFSLATSFVFFLLPLYVYSGFRFSWVFKRNILHLNTKIKYKIHFSSKKWWIVWGVLLGVIVLTGIIFAFVGPINSIYKNGTFTYITLLGNTNSSVVDTNGLIQAIKNALGSSWTLSSINTSGYLSAVSGVDTTGQGYYYLVIQGYSNNSYSLSTIQNLIKPILTTYYTSSNSSTLISNIVNNIGVYQVSSSIISMNITKAIYALLAGYGFLAIYYSIRLNILTILPIFATSLVSLGIIFGFSYIVQFEINILFVYAVVFASVTTTLFSCLYVSVSKTRFIRRRIFDKEKIQNFILNNLRSLYNVMFITTIANFAIFVSLAWMISPILAVFFVNVLVANIVAMPLGLFLIAHLYYYVILIRQKYVLTILDNFENRIKHEFKESDEQLIMGINKFH